MRLTLVASLIVCGFCCPGCETLGKTAHWPNKNSKMTEQLAMDEQRRQAAEKEVSKLSNPPAQAKAIQQTNMPVANVPAGGEVDGILLKAKQAEQSRQNQVARSLYEQVLQQQPQNAEAHHRLGVLADQDGKYAEARQHYQAALQQTPQNPNLLSDVGYSCYSQDRLDEAEQYLNSALQVQPGNQYARNNLAQVYARRAQQTGSAADYKLAQEQFTLALGPQGAEQQMKQIFPQGMPSGADRRGLSNPFRKIGARDKSRPGSNLQAPEPPEDGNAKLLKQMAEIREGMIRNGELPASAGPAGPRANGSVVPLNQMNEELSRIDNEANLRMAEAMRRSYPAGQVPYNPANAGNQGPIEQTGGFNDPRRPNGPTNYAATPDQMSGGGNGRPAQYGQPDYAQQAGGAFDNRMGAADPAGGYGQSGQRSGRGLTNGGVFQNASTGASNPVPARIPGAEQGNSPDQLSQTWPSPDSAATQMDARGYNWDGQGFINDGSGRQANGVYVQNDPTWRTGNGQGFGPQRPNAAPGSWGRNGGTTNDGRQAAAQLGLDAGMGEMFPDTPGDATSPNGGQENWQQRPQGSYPPADRSPWQNGDPAMYGDQGTPRGMQPGGSGAVAPADYYAPPPGFQNNGYSQGVTPTMGENYGASGSDVTAPWNQPGTSPRGNRMPGQYQYGNGGTQSRFAPGRQPPSQNFGAPPMYYGR